MITLVTVKCKGMSIRSWEKLHQFQSLVWPFNSILKVKVNIVTWSVVTHWVLCLEHKMNVFYTVAIDYVLINVSLQFIVLLLTSQWLWLSSLCTIFMHVICHCCASLSLLAGTLLVTATLGLQVMGAHICIRIESKLQALRRFLLVVERSVPLWVLPGVSGRSQQICTCAVNQLWCCHSQARQEARLQRVGGSWHQL
jgi:hypothetical protein